MNVFLSILHFSLTILYTSLPPTLIHGAARQHILSSVTLLPAGTVAYKKGQVFAKFRRQRPDVHVLREIMGGEGICKTTGVGKKKRYVRT